MAKDRTEEILDSLLKDIGIEVDEFIAQVNKREPVKASSDELPPQKNDTPSPIPKSGDAPALPSGTKATQPKFDPENLKKTFAPKPKAPEGPEYGFNQASSPSGMSGGGSPDVQQSISGYDPNSKLPWFKHGMKGFFRKLWHGDHPENPSWQGYKAEQRLTLDECIFLNKQISEKVDQLSSQFLTEAVMTDYDDLVNSLKEKIASHFRQAVAEARQKGSNSRGAGRKSNLDTLKDFLRQLGKTDSELVDLDLDAAVGALEEKIDMEGWTFSKIKNSWILKNKLHQKHALGSQPGKKIIQGLIDKKKAADEALGRTDSAEVSSSSAPTADGKGDDKPTTSGVVSKVKPISPPIAGDESGKEGDNADVASKTAKVFTNKKSKEFIELMPRVLGDEDAVTDIYSQRSWKNNIANSEDKELKSFYKKRLEQHNAETKESRKFEELNNAQQLKLHIQVMADLISKHGFSGELSPEEILKMDKSAVIERLNDFDEKMPVDHEPVELSQGPSKGKVSTYKFEGMGLDAYRATKILEQLNPHHKLMCYKKLLSCGVRMSSDKINLSEVKINEKVKYLKEKLHH